MINTAFADRSVLVTGHTGFKGSWLCAWLLKLGAKVHGLALSPQPHEILYDQLNLSPRLSSDTRGDIRDLGLVTETIAQVKPDYLFHLAAQPLVRLSFDIPVETYQVNVMGTIHVLEALRTLKHSCSAVFVTTDKCYENREWLHAYREVDAMGGYDPYSSSKGCAELAIESFRRSYFSDYTKFRIASARAGNVIGGGDWAQDRIVPDIMRALRAKSPVPVRNKHSTRPWQHVLEPLSGYLCLAAHLDPNNMHRRYPLEHYCNAFNFGPNVISNRTVADVVEEVLKYLPGSWEDKTDPSAVHEASKLNLSTEKAYHSFGWLPAWNFTETIQKTAEWYDAEAAGVNVNQLTIQQIADYEDCVSASGRSWFSTSN